MNENQLEISEEEVNKNYVAKVLLKELNDGNAKDVLVVFSMDLAEYAVIFTPKEEGALTRQVRGATLEEVLARAIKMSSTKMFLNTDG